MKGMKKHTGINSPDFPTMPQLETELRRVRRKRRYITVIRSTVFTLVTIAAIAVLISTLWLPVFRIYGGSMTPTMENGQIVVAAKSNDFNTGDLIVFKYNNKILVKRVIASSGDWVNIDKNGTVFVNDKELREPYLSERALGECDIKLPYQVPESRLFVMGDHRGVSVDSRSKTVGCISDEQIVGKILFRVWPLDKFGKVG